MYREVLVVRGKKATAVVFLKKIEKLKPELTFVS